MVVELVDYFCSEQPADSSVILCPAIYFFRIRPHQISKCSLIRDLLLPVNFPDLVEGFNIRRKATVDTKDVIFMSNGVLSMMAVSGR